MTAANLETVNLSPGTEGNAEAKSRVKRPDELDRTFTIPASVSDNAS